MLLRPRGRHSAHLWGFALYRASHDDYEDLFLPSGTPAGTAEEALDCACGLYLNDPSAWLPDTPTNQLAEPLAGGGQAPLPASSQRNRVLVDRVGPAKPSLVRYRVAYDERDEYQ